MALALGLPLAIQLVGAVAGDAGYRSAINLARRDSLATIQMAGGASPDSYSQLQASAAQSVDSNTGARLALVAEHGTTSGLTVRSVNGKQPSLEGLLPVEATYYPTLQQKARLESGVWPAAVQADSIQATVSEVSVGAYGWKLGDVICLSAADDLAAEPAEACARLVGVWSPTNPNDRFWLAPPPSNAITFSGDGYWAVARTIAGARFTTTRIYQPSSAHLIVAEAPDFKAGIARLRSSLLLDHFELFTTLDQTIGALLERSAVNRFPVQLVGADLIVVVLIGLGLLTNNFLTAQEEQSKLWRIRGWSRLEIARFVGAQLLLLMVPALLAATLFAIAATWVQASRYGVDLQTTAADIATHLGPALVLTAVAVIGVCGAIAIGFSWRIVGQTRRATRARSGAVWWRRGNADLALALIALPILTEATLRGQIAARSSGNGLDLIGLCLPILGLAFLSIAALRLLPLVAQPLRLMGHDVAVLLAGWRLSRQPQTHAGVAVLLSLTLAVGLFASIYAATANANAIDRAAYQAGADLRINFAPNVGPAEITNEVSRLNGVTAATSVIRDRIQIGESVTATALALDPVTFGKAAWSRPGLTSPTLVPALAQMSGHTNSLELRGQPTELRMSASGSNGTVAIEAEVRDAADQVCHCTFGTVVGGSQAVRAPIAFAAAARYPLRLEALRIHRLANGTPGAIQITGLQSVSGPEVSNIESFATVSGWWTRDDLGLVTAPGISQLQPNGGAALDVPVSASGDTMLYPPFGRNELPVLMATPTMSSLSLRPGDSFPMYVDSHQIIAKLTGAVDYVPTLYPGSDDFVVLPLANTVSVFGAALGRSVSPTELWLAMIPQAERSALSVIPSSNVDFVVSREHEQALARNDAVLIQLNANLATGAAGALLLAFVGFAVHFLIAARRRIAEHAILEANGLEPGDIRRGLAIEQALIAVFALLVAVALAIIAIEVLLPSLQFGTTPPAVIPPTVIQIDWTPMIVVGAGVAAGIALLAWVTQRIGTSVDVVDEIRRLG